MNMKKFLKPVGNSIRDNMNRSNGVQSKRNGSTRPLGASSPSRAKSREGSAVVLVLVAIVILFVMGTGLLSLGLHSRIFAAQTVSDISARCAADAGLTKALFEMNEKLAVQPWDDSTLPQAISATLPNCDATFSYTVTGDAGSGFTIESTGNSVRGEKTVSSTLRLQGLFDYGVLTQGTITLKADTLVDGYNSGDPTDTDVSVQIATTSDDPDSIVLYSGATVDGEILTGVDYDFPTVTPPAFDGPDTAIELQGTTLTISPADSGKYTSIDLDQEKWKERGETFVIPAILVIDGGDVVLYVTGDIEIGNGCEIIIRPGSSLTIYLDGDFIAFNSAGINNETGIPSSFALFGTGEDQTFELKAKSDTFGVIYAPDADVTIKAQSDVCGSFICSQFEMKSGGNLYYDGALRDASVSDVGARFVVERWQE